MKLPLCALGVFALAAACAPTAQTASAGPAGKECFNSRFINGYANVDDDTVRVMVGPQRDYEIDFQGPNCREIRWSNAIAIVSRPSAWICVGDKVGAGDVKFRDGGTNTVTSCYITDVRRYVKPASTTPPPAAQ